jgi:hypothetical protein
MSNFLLVLVLMSLTATVAVLAVGLGGFIQGRAFNQRWGNSLMRARVVLQGLTILLLLLYFASRG